MAKSYKDWLSKRKKSNGDPYAEGTINSYTSSLSNAPGRLTGIELPTTNLYEIHSTETFKKVRRMILNAENFEEVNIKAGNKAFQYALEYYEEFLLEQESGSESDKKYPLGQRNLRIKVFTNSQSLKI